LKSRSNRIKRCATGSPVFNTEAGCSTERLWVKVSSICVMVNFDLSSITIFLSGHYGAVEGPGNKTVTARVSLPEIIKYK